MADPRLVTYLRNAIAKGYSKITLYTYLQKQGWPSWKLQDAFNVLEGKASSTPQRPTTQGIPFNLPGAQTIQPGVRPYPGQPFQRPVPGQRLQRPIQRQPARAYPPQQPISRSMRQAAKPRFTLPHIPPIYAVLVASVMVLSAGAFFGLSFMEKDCGTDEACLRSAAENCRKAAGILQEGGIQSLLQIKGSDGSQCGVYMEVLSVQTASAPPEAASKMVALKGKTMDCSVDPDEFARNFDLEPNDRCKGSLVAGLLDYYGTLVQPVAPAVDTAQPQALSPPSTPVTIPAVPLSTPSSPLNRINVTNQMVNLTKSCTTNAGCNDTNKSTLDICSQGVCKNTPITACKSSDGYCPKSCAFSNDTDCPLNKANGEVCSGASDCASGFCVDGLCCNTACNDKTCQTCGPLSNNSKGICGYMKSSILDPNEECSTAAPGQPGSCQTGFCSGSGFSCGFTVPEAQSSSICCGSHANCNDNNYYTLDRCTGGICENTLVSCAHNDGICPDACTPANDNDCPRDKKPNGESCSVYNECNSGFCADGVCCNTACNDKLCQTCSELSSNGKGSCGYITGAQDPNNECTTALPGQPGACQTTSCSGTGYSCGFLATGEQNQPACQKCSGASPDPVNYTINSKDEDAENQCTGTGKYCDGSGICRQMKWVYDTSSTVEYCMHLPGTNYCKPSTVGRDDIGISTTSGGGTVSPETALGYLDTSPSEACPIWVYTCQYDQP